MFASRPRSSLTVAVVTSLLAACGGSQATAPAPSNTAGDRPGADGPGGRVAALPCTAETVAGSWRVEAGSDFEEITLESDGTFLSHLHDRPFLGGTWSVDDGALVLSGDDGTATRIDGARCATALIGTTDGADVRWDRLEPTP
ncbi:MAG: hypothetical protein H6709_06890 [Kofleriaceae bacterium]|nr:hypothetical protein [Myxococcales bacterium]MCB9560144.1 hypothetical protein [Kofleriaceae bacterium]MCB9571803.1 hypothetical protein [Kofleriaceae bacterium]